jgi:DNA-binding transcriptional MerR regulator
MTQRQEQTSIDLAARQTGLEPRIIRRLVRVGLVSGSLTGSDLAELRRIRRLTELEVNMAGVEIIVRMRRRIIDLQTALEQSEGPEGRREEVD